MSEDNKNIKTTITYYQWNLDIPEQKEEYLKMVEKLRDGRKWMNAWGGNHKYHKPGTFPIELETKFLFNNQWNSTDERVLDWYEEWKGEKSHWKCGHYLEITQEMRDIRDNHIHCGYCGNIVEKSTGMVFCNKCLNSPYLKQEELWMLRMLPISSSDKKRSKTLTQEETEYLLPLYIEAQTKLKEKVTAELRENLKKRRDKVVDNANIEYNAMIWLLDHGLTIENWIYYDHQNEFCFGWRNPVSKEVVDAVSEILKQFPYKYTIKGE